MRITLLWYHGNRDKKAVLFGVYKTGVKARQVPEQCLWQRRTYNRANRTWFQWTTDQVWCCETRDVE